jgi:hypothetical protein
MQPCCGKTQQSKRHLSVTIVQSIVVVIYYVVYLCTPKRKVFSGEANVAQTTTLPEVNATQEAIMSGDANVSNQTTTVQGLKAPPEANMSQKQIAANMNQPNIHGEVMNLQEKPDDGKETNLSSMPIFGKNNNNGLLFAPTCTTCFNENKYLLLSKKKCLHQWTNECLNSTGEYIIFPSEMYHCGYYNQKSNQIFIQAQLFCAPTGNTDVLRLPRFLMKAQGQQVTRRCLDESTLSELRDDLLNNWEILYSNPKY